MNLPLSSQIADAVVTIMQADAILELIADHEFMEASASSAIHGAAMVLRAGVAELEKIEIAARRAEVIA